MKYGGCPEDAGWFVVSDVIGSKPCPWEKSKDYPQFLYTKNGKVEKWSNMSESHENGTIAHVPHIH